MISVNAEKNLWQNSTCFPDTSPWEDRTRGNVPQHNKSYALETTNIILNGTNLELNPLRSGMRQGHSLCQFTFNIVFKYHFEQ